MLATLSTIAVYLLVGFGCLSVLGTFLAPLCLGSGLWAWASGKSDAAKADEIDRLLAER